LPWFYTSPVSRSPIVCSIRHPLDAIASSIQRFDEKPTPEVFRHHLQMFESQGMWDVLRLRNSRGALILKYERFAHDYEYLLDSLADFFSINIPVETRRAFAREYSIATLKKRSEEIGTFSGYDSASKVHGKHISKYGGASGYYQDYFEPDQISEAYAKFKPIFDAFEYHTEGI
jgi:hypothetical protein